MSRIVFRADGNSTVGTGHVMRCLSIADTFKSHGHECVFITAEDEFKATIALHGHKSIVLHSDFREMGSELDKIVPVISELQPAAMFVDSYYVTAPYLESLQKLLQKVAGRTASLPGKCAGLIYIDDVMAFPYPCDVLINYNIYGPDQLQGYNRMYEQTKKAQGDEGRTGIFVSEPVYLLGTAYAPLRAEFQKLPARLVRKEATDILISTGGADFEHMATALIKETQKLQESHLRFHFVVGAMNKDRDEIRALADEYGCIVMHENVRDMCRLMQGCDAAISAAGSTLYELCATQTPAITYILADNQIPGARGFEAQGVLRCAGDVRRIILQS